MQGLGRVFTFCLRCLIRAAAGREASSVTFAQHDSSSTATVSGRAQEPVGARTTTFGLVGRLARKLAQAVAGSGNGQQASRSQQRRGSAQTAQVRFGGEQIF